MTDRAAFKAVLCRHPSASSAARDLGVHVSTVAYWVKAHRITTEETGHRPPITFHPKNPLRNDRAGLVALLRQEGTFRAVARVVGMCPETIMSWVRRHGITREEIGPRRSAPRASRKPAPSLNFRCVPDGILLRELGVTRPDGSLYDPLALTPEQRLGLRRRAHRAWRDRMKETHPDHGHDASACIRLNAIWKTLKRHFTRMGARE